MRVSRRIRLAALAVILVVMVAGRLIETRRLAVPLPRDPAARSAVRRLDPEQLLLDVQILSSDRFEGRATGTRGGAMAAAMIAARFSGLKLSRFGARFEQPFSFVHRSIRALWRRDRPFVKAFDGATNLVGYVPGTSMAGDFIVVSAHFDHLGLIGGEIYHGADDNASGVAALLSLARWTSEHPMRHSIVFAAFDAEELGLRGSRAFVDALPFAREHLLLDVNIDMIGRGDAGRLFVAGVARNPALRPVVESAARTSDVALHLGHDRPMYLTGLVDDWTHASDQGPFHDAGVPFLYFGVEDHADLHEPTDTSDRIDSGFLAAAAETVLSAVIAADAR